MTAPQPPTAPRCPICGTGLVDGGPACRHPDYLYPGFVYRCPECGGECTGCFNAAGQEACDCRQGPMGEYLGDVTVQGQQAPPIDWQGLWDAAVPAMQEAAPQPPGSYLNRVNGRMMRYHPHATVQDAEDMLAWPENYPEVWLDGWEQMTPDQRRAYWETT